MAERGGQHAQDLKTRLRRAPRRAAAGRAQVLLHRRDLGALDRGHRAGRRRPPGAGVRRAGRPGRARRRGLGRDGPARHGQRVGGLRRRRRWIPAWSSPTSEAFEGPQQLGARPSSCTPRSRSASRAARCATPASSSGPGRGRSSRRPGPGGRMPRRTTRTPSTGSASWPPGCARPRRCSPPRRPRWRRSGRQPRDAAAAARGSVAVAQAKAFASEIAVAVASDLFALTGASAADERYDLSRHWRNARTHASHDPVDWKYHHIGNYLLSDVPPPEPRTALAMTCTEEPRRAPRSPPPSSGTPWATSPPG